MFNAQATDKSPEHEGPQSGPEPGVSGTSDDSNDDGKHAVLTQDKRRPPLCSHESCKAPVERHD